VPLTESRQGAWLAAPPAPAPVSSVMVVWCDEVVVARLHERWPAFIGAGGSAPVSSIHKSFEPAANCHSKVLSSVAYVPHPTPTRTPPGRAAWQGVGGRGGTSRVGGCVVCCVSCLCRGRPPSCSHPVDGIACRAQAQRRNARGAPATAAQQQDRASPADATSAAGDACSLHTPRAVVSLVVAA